MAGKAVDAVIMSSTLAKLPIQWLPERIRTSIEIIVTLVLLPIIGIIGSFLQYFKPETFKRHLVFKRDFGNNLQSHAPYNLHKAFDTFIIAFRKLIYAIFYEINTNHNYISNSPVYAITDTESTEHSYNINYNYQLTQLNKVIDTSKYTVLLCGSFS